MKAGGHMRIHRTLCADCSELVPINARVCPNCGRPKRSVNRIFRRAWRIIELLALIATTAAIVFLIIAYNQMEETIELQKKAMDRDSAQQIVEDSMAMSEIGFIQTQISLISRQIELQEKSSELQSEQSELSRIKITAEQKPYVLALSAECSTDSLSGLYRTRIVVGNTGKSIASNAVIWISTAVSSPKSKDLTITDSSFCGDLVPNRPFTIIAPFGDSAQLSKMFSALEADNLVLYLRIEAAWKWSEMELTEHSTRYFELKIPAGGGKCNSSLISEFDALKIFRSSRQK
jgi:hypothetical protein